MNRALFRLVDTLSRHQALVGWLAALAAFAVAGAGILAGTSRAPAFASSLPVAGITAGPLATIAPGRVSVQGVIVAVRPRGLIVATPGRQPVLVRVDRQTRYRVQGKAATHAALRRGQKVVVLGRTDEGGVMHARAVTARGAAKSAPAPMRSPTPAD